jgi:diguanylate cyclase (GGDEF)-like protein/PAS domain S-box-containing protein
MLQGAGTPSSTRALPARVSWWFVAVACGATGLAVASRSETVMSFSFDAVSLAAGLAAIYGIIRNRPVQRTAWLLVALGLALSAAGDVVYDLVTRGFGASSGYPWADLCYLPAYPCFAIALLLLAGPRRRDTAVDSAIVTLAAAALIWQWVLTPVISSSGSATFESLISVVYPIMDVVLVVAIVHAVFTLPRWITAARFLFVGLATMLVADIVFARLVADGVYVDGGTLDALWPIAYTLLAAAALHPSMRAMSATREPGLVRSGRARVLVLAAALFSVPALIVIDGASSNEAVALTAIVAATATLVAWRIAHLVTETNHAREVIGASEARFRALVQYSSDAVAVIDSTGVVTYMAPTVTTMLGYEADDLLGHNVMELMHPSDAEASADMLQRLTSEQRSSERLEVRVRHADGSWRWIDATCTNQVDEPSIVGIVGNFRDVTERKRMERAGLGETRVLELVLHGAPLGETLHALLETIEDFIGDAAAIVRLIDPETDVLQSVAAPTLPLSYVRTIDQCLDAMDGGPERLYEPLLVDDLDAGVEYPELRAAARAHGLRSFWSLPISVRGSDTPLGFLGVYTRQVRIPSAREHTMLERTRDLASLALDRAAQNQQLGFLALHDTLTELPNRALGVERLDAALHAMSEHDQQVAVLFLDLDRFKVVNDGLGHDTGDDLLVAVGRRLAGVVRQHDTVARFGGDEFVVICERLRDETQAIELAERILEVLALPFALERAEVMVSASIGIALTMRPTDHASELLRDADAAMYRAKSLGGNRYELFDQHMHTQAVTRLLTERALRSSLEHDELRVLFQPQFDLVTGVQVAAEALLRWAHPSRGLVLPSDFLSVAEETGLIVPIGEWVTEEVCRHLRHTSMDDPGAMPVPVSMNVSGRQLRHAKFVEQLKYALARHDVDPALVCLEVSENALVADPKTVRTALHDLKDLGVRLAIDDFGTGGSSLTYLRRFPFDELKIDGTFVAGLGRSPADDAITAATIDMAHALGMLVSAEGVETEAQRLRLIELGCERGQGYHLGAPEAVDAPRLHLVQRLA